MQPKIRAEICPVCKGRGVHPHTGSVCENCRGAGGIGTDGVNEYYLEHDGKGNVRVIGIKSSKNNAPQYQTQGSSASRGKTKRSTILKGLWIIAFIIVLVGYLGLHFTLIQDMKVLIVVMVILFGFLILILLYDTSFMNALVKLLTKVIIREPQDFLTVLKGRKKQASTD